jgi:tetratricopeptide (TPR) repeat protein
MIDILNAVRSTFDDRDQARLAFFSLFQRVIDVEILIFMGIPQFVSQDEPMSPWALRELLGMQRDDWNDLAMRAHELRLVAQAEDGLWLIENEVANGLRLLMPLAISTESQCVRAFVESTAFSAQQHFIRVRKGDPSAERQIRMNEANYLSAVSTATSSKWPNCILEALEGLQVIYLEPKRLNEWKTLLKSVVSIFTDARTSDALPGMEDMWLVMTGFELGVLLRESRWQEAYPLQAKVVEKLEQAAKPWLTGLRGPDDEGLHMIRRFAGELSKLGDINQALGRHGLASRMRIRSRQLVETNAADAALTRAEMILWSARELKPEDERRQKLVKEGIGVAEGALKSAVPGNQEFLAHIHSVLGSLQREAELFDEALRRFEEALFIRKAMGNSMGAGRAQGNIADVLLATGHRRKALEALKRAEALFIEAGDKGQQDLDYTRKAIEEVESELLKTGSPDSDNSKKSMERNRVIRAMVANIRRGDPREYFVGLVGYFIEGYPYPASGLGVDSYSTPDIHVTEDGFACTGIFAARMLQPATTKGRQIIKRDVNGVPTDMVAVNVEIKFDDIYLIGGFWDREQHELLSDRETMASRKLRFMRDTGLWYQRRNAERNAQR